jgi:hypothetical protein
MKYLVVLLLPMVLVMGCSEEPKKKIIYMNGGSGDDNGDADTGDADTGDGDTGDGSSDADTDADGDSDGDSDVDTDADADYDSEDYQELDTGEACGDWELSLDLHKSRLMILQDISYSMAQGVPTKWEQAREAMERLLGTFGNSGLLEFGLDAFPRGGYCGTSGPVVLDCGPGQASVIEETMDNLDLGDGTPLYRAMQNFADPTYAPVFADTEVPHYLVVLTDGQDVCGTDPDNTDVNGATAAELQDMTEDLLFTQNIMTVAIGFGEDVDADQLNAIAANGGTPFTEYMVAADRDELLEAFVDIVALTISCRFEIDPQQIGDDEMDRNLVNFYFDGETLPMDDDCRQGEGWTWVNAERTIVEFCEQACDDLKYGEVIEITGRFGCDTKVMVK